MGKVNNKFGNNLGNNIEGGYIVHISNGYWDGLVIFDTNKLEYKLLVLETGAIFDIGKEVNFDKLGLKIGWYKKLDIVEYLKYLYTKDLVIGSYKGDICIYKDRFYMLSEDEVYVSDDEEYKKSQKLKLVSDEGNLEVDIKDVSFRYQDKYIKELYEIKDKSIMNQIIVKSMIENNNNLKEELNRNELLLKIEKGDKEFKDFIISVIEDLCVGVGLRVEERYRYYFGKLLKGNEGIKGIYIKGDYEVSGKQARYLYYIEEDGIRLMIKDEREGKEREDIIDCSIKDLKEGFKILIDKHPEYSIYQYLEHLARIDFFELEDKKYIEDNKWNQSQY